MKISEMIKNLEAVMLANGDLECYYAVDDEGNAYHPVYFEPSVYYINHYGDVFQDEDLEGEDEEDIAELRHICIVN
jgi:hypothetical protein